MKRLASFFLIIAASAGVATPQAAKDSRLRLTESIEARDNQLSIAILREEKQRDLTAFESNDHDYLLGRIAEADGQTTLAVQNYLSVIRRRAELTPYALARLSKVARTTGNPFLERIYLQQLVLAESSSILAGAANWRLARNAYESGNYGETIHILRTSAEREVVSPSHKPRQIVLERDRQVLLGNAYLFFGEPDRARNIFNHLLEQMPDKARPDDGSHAAVKALDLIDGGQSEKREGPELPEAEHLRRANIYQFNRDFVNARRHYEAVIARFRLNAAEAVFQIGRGYSQSMDHAEALKWYERVLESYPDTAVAPEALLQAAAAYSRVGKPREAISRYESFIEKYPTRDKLDRAYLNVVDILRDQGLDQEALKWCSKTEEALRGKPAEAVAIFTQARIFIAREEWQQALSSLDRLRPFPDLGGATIPGGTSSAEVRFLRGLILEKTKRFAEAVDTYLSIPDGRNEYYGWRANERLAAMTTDDRAAPAVAQKIGQLSRGLAAKDAEERRGSAQSLLRLAPSAEVRDRAVAALRSAISVMPMYPSVQKLSEPKETRRRGPKKTGLAGRLIELGLYDDAIVEGGGGDLDPLILSTRFSHGDRGDRVMETIDPIWKKHPADHPIELIPRHQLRLLYPVVYAGPLVRYSTEAGVDPRLMLAIMRQESRFRPDAKSNAAARGLMQFISSTSMRVAGELGRRGFLQEDLYDPTTSILFGSHYVAGLFRVFPNQPEAVVGAYNGGDENMKRWLARARSNVPDRYVSEIMFTQTKDYVQKVMANYRIYKYLYDENLRPVEE